MSTLEAGAPAPSIELLDQNGNHVSLADYKGKYVLIFFYPKASTPGCTTQACSVRDNLEDLAGENVVVLGISPDLPEKQLKFDAKYKFGYPLLSDPEKEVANAYGVWGEKSLYGKKYMGIIRSSFLVDPDGNLAEVWYKVSPKNTVPFAKKALKK